jgi:hypothetical protein
LLKKREGEKVKKVIFATLTLVFFITIGFGAVPNEIRYTGRLKAYKEPVNGETNIKITLYGDPEGVNQLWTTGTKQVNVSSGIFTYVLTPNFDWRKGNVWLELNVNGRTLLPREKVMADMYSLHAYEAENLSSDDEIKVSIGTSTVYLGIRNNKLFVRTSSDAVTEIDCGNKLNRDLSNNTQAMIIVPNYNTGDTVVVSISGPGTVTYTASVDQFVKGYATDTASGDVSGTNELTINGIRAWYEFRWDERVETGFFFVKAGTVIKMTSVGRQGTGIATRPAMLLKTSQY